MEAIAINRKFRSKAQPNARCIRSHQTKAQERTAPSFADAFLRHRFVPIISKMPEQLKNQMEVERDFFNSLSHLQNLYGFEVEDNSDLFYPCNIAAAWQEAVYQMDKVAPETGMALMGGEFEKVTITTYKSYNVGQFLYYIPLQPLWVLLQDKRRKPLAGVLLSVFAYLYQSVRIADYTSDDNYLYYTYERLRQWYKGDDGSDRQCIKELKAAISLAKRKGKAIFARLGRTLHLRTFAKRLAAFHPMDEYETAVQQVAEAFLGLSTRYPDRAIGHSFLEGFIEPEEIDRISPDQYLSFIWDNNDIVSDDLIEYINNDLMEMPVMDEPLAMQFFNRPQQQPCHDLSFETELFQAIDSLIYLLNNL